MRRRVETLVGGAYLEGGHHVLGVEKFLLKLRGVNDIIFALADKNLGSVAVTFKQYIKDSLVHLMDSSTCEISCASISEKWILKHAIDLPQDVRHFLRSKLDETQADPFGSFYLLYKIHRTPVNIRHVCSDCASATHTL